MKKFLIGTSALVAAGVLATGAQAGETDGIHLTISGFANQYVGFRTNEDDFEAVSGETGDVHAFSNSEVHFTGETKLDNGLRVSFKIEMEGDAAANIDESFVAVDGGFGRIEMGNNDAPSNALHVGIPAVGALGTVDTDAVDWVGIPSAVDASGLSIVIEPDFAGDNKKVSYYTPSFNGFQAGVAFTPQTGYEAKGALGGIDAEFNKIWSLGAAYNSEINGVSLAASAGADFARRPSSFVNGDDTALEYAFGLNVGFGNITVGAEYSQAEDQSRTQANDENTTYAVGVSYAAGAAVVSLGWQHAEYESDSVAEAEYDYVDLGAEYKLGAGVTWKSSLAYMTVDGDGSGGANDNEGIVVATGLALSF